MENIFEEIKKLRNEKSLSIDRKNNNRYRVVVNEKDGSRTSYFFGVPIYSRSLRKLINLNFNVSNGKMLHYGTNSTICISDKITIECENNCCTIEFPNTKEHTAKFSPTVNGIAIESDYNEDTAFSFKLKVDRPIFGVRGNKKFFSLMSEQFKPLLTISCIGTIENEKIVSPCRVLTTKITETEFYIKICSFDLNRSRILFEVNAYESKLIQDTTVESKTPLENNVFGGTGFIGESKYFGDQWLYSRPITAMMPEICDRAINSVVLHIPMLNDSESILKATQVSARFCSFNSNWENKLPDFGIYVISKIRKGYQSLDLSKLILDDRYQYLKKSSGFIIRSCTKGSQFCAISTGDSYFLPQIYEINYK